MADNPSYDELMRRIQILESENAGLRKDLSQHERSEAKYRMMIENIPDLIWVLSADGSRTTYLSPSVETILGFSKAEIRNKTIWDFVTPETMRIGAAYLAEERERLKKDPSRARLTHSFDIEYIRKDKTILQAELTARTIVDESGQIIEIIGVSRDMSQRAMAEKSLKKSEARYRSLFENSRDAIYIMTIDGRVIEFNPAGIELFGYSREEMIGSDILKIYHDPADRGKFKKTIREKGYVRDYEIKFKKKNGTLIDCLLTSSLWYADDGEILGYQGIIRDITEQKRMVRQLQQVQKMEAIGTLAGGIAHNFNNLLMTIQGNTSLMLMKTDPSHPHYRKLRTIEQHIQHGADLSRQLLGFARGSHQESKTVDLNAIIRMTAKIFSSTKKEMSVFTQLADGLLPVNADPGQMEQSLLNLLVNAAQAMPDGGDIFIQTENVLLEPYRLAFYQDLGGQYVKLSVTDTGSGMDKSIQEKIFEPFFTTKAHGQGTGLGLSSVYGIVKNHRGYILVTSEPGKGSTFTIYLPASENPLEVQKNSSAPLLRGTETVLIVDDEVMLTETGGTMLKELGYTVLTANDGMTAIETFTAHRETIDLVILDLIMPKMSGGETFTQLKAIDPDVTVLISSGYGINGPASDLLKKGARGFIQKPFSLLELSQKVREVLR